jgi:hypothetical protein
LFDVPLIAHVVDHKNKFWPARASLIAEGGKESEKTSGQNAEKDKHQNKSSL